MTSSDANVAWTDDHMPDVQWPEVQWQGLNHLALITNDMDTTVRFSHGVMGAPLIACWYVTTFGWSTPGSDGPTPLKRSGQSSVVRQRR